MGELTYLITKGSITLIVDGKLRVISKGDRRYDLIVKAISDGRTDDVGESAEVERFLVREGLHVLDKVLNDPGDPMSIDLANWVEVFRNLEKPDGEVGV